jgi:hypothetical protein
MPSHWHVGMLMFNEMFHLYKFTNKYFSTSFWHNALPPVHVNHFWNCRKSTSIHFRVLHSDQWVHSLALVIQWTNVYRQATFEIAENQHQSILDLIASYQWKYQKSELDNIDKMDLWTSEILSNTNTIFLIFL